MIEPSVLVVEDDPVLRGFLREGLIAEGFAPAPAPDAESALRTWSADIDLAIIDIGLPDADGRELCQTLRGHGFVAPVLFLSARHAVVDRLSAFRAGGDDFLAKPFSFAELVMRLRALLRRGSGGPPVGTLAVRLDPLAHTATSGDFEVSLTPTEFRLLATLVASPDRVVRRRDLVHAAWPEGAIVHDNTLDQYVARLRRKLRELASDCEISTVHGVGYRLG